MLKQERDKHNLLRRVGGCQQDLSDCQIALETTSLTHVWISSQKGAPGFKTSLKLSAHHEGPAEGAAADHLQAGTWRPRCGGLHGDNGEMTALIIYYTVRVCVTSLFVVCRRLFVRCAASTLESIQTSFRELTRGRLTSDPPPPVSSRCCRCSRCKSRLY